LGRPRNNSRFHPVRVVKNFNFNFNRTDVYHDTEVSLPFTSVAFSFSLNPGRDLSDFWAVDSACSFDLTASRGDFVTFEPSRGRLASAV
jgi:hypothetical protein